MYKLQLIENCNSPLRFNIVCSKTTYELIESYQYLGGFKRFEIDLYDDNSKELKTRPTKVKEYLNELTK